MLKPLARIVASAAAGVEPRIMGMGPVPASRKALEKAGTQRSTRWTSSSSTKLSPRNRSPASASSASPTTTRASIPTAAPSRSATRSACPARDCCSPPSRELEENGRTIRALHDVHRRRPGHGDDHRARADPPSNIFEFDGFTPGRPRVGVRSSERDGDGQRHHRPRRLRRTRRGNSRRLGRHRHRRRLQRSGELHHAHVPGRHRRARGRARTSDTARSSTARASDATHSSA